MVTICLYRCGDAVSRLVLPGVIHRGAGSQRALISRAGAVNVSVVDGVVGLNYPGSRATRELAHLAKVPEMPRGSIRTNTVTVGEAHGESGYEPAQTLLPYLGGGRPL